ncbi:helix-turn-helix domain-containing protein [Kibdelosporangium phytohabitans]|nr:helix-turn-helix transcriptional regulator [Kibdelosporangium phytohabitans]MBE1467697.1 transcriptional regulator with XRE-family HTH domain [Kibdelosporangium phytohabitans]
MPSGQRRTAERIQVGTTLKRMRLEAGLTREVPAGKLGISPTTIGNIEQGRTKIAHTKLAALLELYGAPADQAADLMEVNREAHRTVVRVPYGGEIWPHQRRSSDLINAATRIGYYSPEIFPGVLQARGYARAIMAPTGHMTDKLEIRINFRLTLGEALTREDDPLELWAVIGEAALHKNIGGCEAMREQLTHVVELCRQRANITVQVLPLNAREHQLLGTTVTIYEVDNLATIASVDTSVSEHFLEHDPLVADAARRFSDVRLKALDPLTSVDMIEEVANRR